MAGWERRAASRCWPTWCSCCRGRRWQYRAGSCGALVPQPPLHSHFQTGPQSPNLLSTLSPRLGLNHPTSSPLLVPDWAKVTQPPFHTQSQTGPQSPNLNILLVK